MVTAKVILGSKIKYGEGDNETCQLGFYADYNSGRNAEWSLFTPSLSYTMVVKPSVAEKFVQGQAYTVTFQENNE